MARATPLSLDAGPGVDLIEQTAGVLCIVGDVSVLVPWAKVQTIEVTGESGEVWRPPASIAAEALSDFNGGSGAGEMLAKVVGKQKGKR